MDKKRGHDSNPGWVLLLLLSWAALRVLRPFQAQVLHELLSPIVVAEGGSTPCAGAQRCQFLIALRFVHERTPVIGSLDRPVAEQVGVAAGFAAPQAAPAPVLGAWHEAGAQRVAFDISQYDQQVEVGLDGEGFEASLIEVAGARGVVMRVPALGVGVGQPLHEVTELAVGLRPQGQVPVVGHEAPGEDADGDALVGLGQNAFEGGVVLVFVEKGALADAPVENVVDQPGGSMARPARHG